MIANLLFAVAIAQKSLPIQDSRVLMVGWNDNLDAPEQWGPLDMENKARVITSLPGNMVLSLGTVPSGWPYSYQWSGVTKDIDVDIARFPVLMARVLYVKGYAHMDIDVLNVDGKATKSFRSSTLQNAGLSAIDLSTVLDPAQYKLRLRLIVGGDNSGCSATYDWVRFLKKGDVDFQIANPGWLNVRPYWMLLR